MIEKDHPHLSLRRQCALLEVTRSSLYYASAGPKPEDLEIQRRIDSLYTERPFYGVRRMCRALAREGLGVNVKRVRRLMRQMGLVAIYPKKHLSQPGDHARRYPYLLRDLVIDSPDQVWCADLTYLPLQRGVAYLAAVMDWHSRYVLSWGLSESLEGTFCLQALHQALRQAHPQIFNTDQGVQFTARSFTKALDEAGVRISHDGRGRCFDNIFIERLWRSVKHEEIYLREYGSLEEARQSLRAYFQFYNDLRPHQGLEYRTPAEVYFAGASVGHRKSSAPKRTVAGTPVALRAPCVPATVMEG